MGSSSGKKAEINVTPLIDVLLVLIIIFMVVVPQHTVGLWSGLRKYSRMSTHPRFPVTAISVVSVNYDRTITINTEPIALEQLPDRLRAIFATRATKVLFVRGHRDLDFQEVAKVIDIAKGADVFQVGLITE